MTCRKRFYCIFFFFVNRLKNHICFYLFAMVLKIWKILPLIPPELKSLNLFVKLLNKIIWTTNYSNVLTWVSAKLSQWWKCCLFPFECWKIFFLFWQSNKSLLPLHEDESHSSHELCQPGDLLRQDKWRTKPPCQSTKYNTLRGSLWLPFLVNCWCSSLFCSDWYECKARVLFLGQAFVKSPWNYGAEFVTIVSCRFSSFLLMLITSCGSWISQTGRGANLLFGKIVAKNCMKIKDIGPGGRPWRLLGSTNDNCNRMKTLKFKVLHSKKVRTIEKEKKEISLQNSFLEGFCAYFAHAVRASYL